MPNLPRNINRSYASIMERRLVDLARVESLAGQRIADVLRDLKGGVMSRIADAPALDLPHLAQIELSIDDEIERARVKFEAAMQDAGFQAAQIGNNAATEPIAKALKDAGAITGTSVEGSILRIGLPENLVEVMQAVTTDLVQDISDELKREVTREVRFAAAGIKTPFEAQQDLAKMLRVSKSKGSKQGPAARAETIVRTEINRIYSVANNDSLAKIQAIVPDLQKQWLTTQDGRQRAAHQALHLEVVDFDKPFQSILGPIRYPLDPRASKGNTIQCRCVMVAIRAEWDAPVNEQAALSVS